MPYRFIEADPSVEDGLRRIPLEQIDKAVAELDDPDLPAHETVHQVRKRCKKLRGLIRLVRPAFGDYAAENAAFRDAANSLSFVRDAAALIETYDALIDAYEAQLDQSTLSSIRGRLVERQEEVAAHHDLDERLADFQNRIHEARDRIHDWRLNEAGFAAIAGGLKKTHKRARRAMQAAGADRRPETLHEWRKRTKYHWYHTRLLRDIWPKPMKAHAEAADELGDLLGTHHDLADFQNRMHEARDRIHDWRLDEAGFAAIAGGLKKTHKRARRAMEAAGADRRPETLHEWRKRTKYHWYHTRLLRDIWPKPMKAHAKAADELGDLLGTHHDLAVLEATLAEAPAAFGDESDIEVVMALIGQRQALLEARALGLGHKLFAESSKALAGRWQAWWDVWQRERSNPSAVSPA